MSFNFPNSPTPGQLYTPVGGYQYIFLDGVWRVVESPQSVGTAQARNYAVNPAFQISQENGDAGLGNTASGAGLYAADQWVANWNVASSVIAYYRDSNLATKPKGITRAIEFYSNTAKPALAAADYAHIYQPLEGSQIAHWKWGTADALPVVLSFWARSSVTGIYTARIMNAANDRSYLMPFTLTAPNIWQKFTFAIPGDTTGTWPTTNALGAMLSFIPAAGSSYVGVAGWQAGSKWCVAGKSVFSAAAPASFPLEE